MPWFFLLNTGTRIFMIFMICYVFLSEKIIIDHKDHDDLRSLYFFAIFDLCISCRVGMIRL